jgi:hypothetical protein
MVFACNRRTDDLASYARGHCSIVADDVREMAEHYRTRLSVADKNLSKDQLDAADLTLGNLGDEARGVMSLALQREFGFCVMIRADKARANTLEQQLHNDLQTYRESPDLQVRSKAVDDMAANAHELTQLALEGQPAP